VRWSCDGSKKLTTFPRAVHDSERQVILSKLETDVRVGRAIVRSPEEGHEAAWSWLGKSVVFHRSAGGLVRDSAPEKVGAACSAVARDLLLCPGASAYLSGYHCMKIYEIKLYPNCPFFHDMVIN